MSLDKAKKAEKEALKLNYNNNIKDVDLEITYSGKVYQADYESYEKVIQIRPNYADAYNNRGTVLQKLNRIEEAVASYKKAIQNARMDDLEKTKLKVFENFLAKL